MKESYGEGLASHTGPESCVGRRKAAGEALTGVHADQPLSSEINFSGVPTLLSKAEGNIGHDVISEPYPDPAESKTLCTRGNSLHGNREVPPAPTADGAVCRSEKANGRTSDMYADGKLDGPIVPKILPNNDGPKTSAEAVEERGPTKGNTSQPAVARTQSRIVTSIGLRGVREAAKKDRNTRFTALLHHITIDQLRDSFHALQRQAAPGVDGVTWKEYQEGLMGGLHDLHGRIHSGAYRAKPSKRTYIPKPDGRMRPLGIAALEDKIVQHASATVLNAIYEVDFLGFSYGFRLGSQRREEADRFLKDLQERLAGFGVSLHPDKTRLIEFGPYAAPKRRSLGQGKAETFDFLGFTHICGRARDGKRFIVKRKTIAKRLRAKLREVKEYLRRHMHDGLIPLGCRLRSVVRGFMNYHAVPGNIASVLTFRPQVARSWFHALRRRGDRHRIIWARFGPFANRWLPRARVLHPHPSLRFYARHPR